MLPVLKNNKPNSHTKYISNLNITPLVDVMLILLVAFIATAPLITNNININLPENTSKVNRNKHNQPILITISKTKDVYLHSRRITIPNLSVKLKSMKKVNSQAEVHIQGDQDIAYKEVTNLINVVAEAGINRISLVTASK